MCSTCGVLRLIRVLAAAPWRVARRRNVQCEPTWYCFRGVAVVVNEKPCGRFLVANALNAARAKQRPSGRWGGRLAYR
jgi:hypothetical protein